MVINAGNRTMTAGNRGLAYIVCFYCGVGMKSFFMSMQQADPNPARDPLGDIAPGRDDTLRDRGVRRSARRMEVSTQRLLLAAEHERLSSSGNLLAPSVAKCAATLSGQTPSSRIDVRL